jgi:hypothetical protein
MRGAPACGERDVYSARARARKDGGRGLDRSALARYHPRMDERPVQPPEKEPVSPFMESPETAPARKPRRNPLPIAVGAAAASVIVIAIVLWAVAPRDAPSPLAGGDKGDVLAPIRPRADLQTGEQVAPFTGFAVSVDTQPTGAVVTIAGVPRGESPVLAGLDCAAGDRVEITAEKRGWGIARAATTCRKDALVKLTVRLPR